MNTLAFDTLAYAKKLKAVGFSEEQAEVQTEALAEVIDDKLATKQDTQGVKQDIQGVHRDIQEMELRLKHDLTLRLGGMMAAAVAIVATLVALL